MLTVGKRILALRKSRGLSQLKLAVSCDPPITQGEVSHLETGFRPGRWETLSRIAVAPHITMDELFRPTPIPVIALARAGGGGEAVAV